MLRPPSERSQEPRPPATDPQNTTEPPGAWAARTAREAVNETERAICGEGATATPSLAAGWAMSGRPAASLLTSGLGEQVSVLPAEAGPWICHRIRTGERFADSDAAFELLASSPQEAVDHCLVAHRIAAVLGRPGVCTMDAKTAEELSLVVLPARETVDALATLREGDPPRGEHVTRTLDVAKESFREVSERTDRPCEAITCHRTDDANFVIVAAGGSASQARDAADALRAEGIACGAVTFGLVRPFPHAEAGEILTGRKAVAVANGALPSPHRSDLLAGIRAAVTAGTGPTPAVRPLEPGALDARSVKRAFGLDPNGSREEARPASPARPPHVAVGVCPPGPLADDFLLDCVAALGGLRPLALARPEPPIPDASVIQVSRHAIEPGPVDHLDVLLLAHPSLLNVTGAGATLARGATVVIRSRRASAEALWEELTEAQRRLFREREIRVGWLDASPPPRAAASDTHHVVLKGALLAASSDLAKLAAPAGSLVDTLVARLGGDPTAELLRHGERSLRWLDLSKLGEVGSAAPSEPGPLRMPSRDGGESEEWREAVRQYHLAGSGLSDPVPLLPLQPAALLPLMEEAAASPHYPLHLPPPGGDGASRTQPLLDVITKALQDLEEAGESAETVKEYAPLLARAAEAAVDAEGGTAPAAGTLERAFETFRAAFDLSDAAAKALAGETDLVRALLPDSGTMLSAGDHTPIALFAAVARTERATRESEFRKRAESLVQRLSDLLRVDATHSPEGSSAEALSASLGDSAERLVDPVALAERLGKRHPGPRRLPQERIEGIRAAVATLKGYLNRSTTSDDLVLVHSGGLPAGLSLDSTLIVEHQDALSVAIGLWDGLAADLADVLRAARLAELEIAGAYDATRHPDVLRRFNWEAFTADELYLLPSVVVAETSRKIGESDLAALSSVLRSGRPIRVVVTESVGEGVTGAVGLKSGLGYLAVGHRDAFVLQSTLAAPEHLAEGLRRMVLALRPAVAFVATPSANPAVASWLELAAAHAGRATPCFLYDPDRGTSWAESFDLSGNPDPDRPWPVHSFDYRDEMGTNQRLDAAFTFAHAAALDPGRRSELRVIPAEAWSDEQVEVAAYLDALRADPPPQIPYLWVVTGDGQLTRAVVSRQLAFACRDQLRLWRILQELGGTRNEYAHRAAEKARKEAEAEAADAMRALETEKADEIEAARREAAGEAMQRLVDVLLDLDSLPARAPVPRPPAAAPSGPAEPAEAQPQAPAAEPPQEQPAEDEDDVSFDEPFIDSVLCTSCNECTNANPRLFKYNTDKQAFIADATAGTFAELVAAAAKCPAKCIHPGKPRGDDATATAELIAKAAEFN